MAAVTALSAITLGGAAGCAGTHGEINLATGEYRYYHYGPAPLQIDVRVDRRNDRHYR